MDKLQHMFELQNSLNKNIGVDVEQMSEKERQQWVLRFSQALMQENAELVDSIPWKWWASYQKYNPQNARVEVVDMFHFLISMAQLLGMTAEDVYHCYLAKNRINHMRQDSGYSIKDEQDSAHI